MLKRNFVKQIGLKDCGPSCLLMIIKHYKGFVELEELIEMCKTSSKGTTAYHLIEVAKSLGFKSYGMKCNLQELGNIILPCIAHVTLNNSYNHFVVIDKIDYKKKRLLIKDPVNKISYYSFIEFEKIFNNIVICMYPIKKIKYTPQNSLLKFIYGIINTSTKQILQIIIISIFITLFSIMTTFYTKNMIDNIFSKSKVTFIFVIFLIIYILKIISNHLRNKLIILVNEKISLNITSKTFKQIINLPYCYYRSHTTGEIISRINDLDILKEGITNSLIYIFIDLPLTLIALIVMYFISKELFLIGLVMFLLYIFIVLIFRNYFQDKIEISTKDKADVTSYMVESINGYETILGCNMKEKIYKKFEFKYANLLNNLYKLDNCYNNQILLKEIINDIGFIIIILVGIFLVIDKQITIGQLIAFNSLLAYFLEPIKNIINLDNIIKQFKISVKKILNLFYKKENNFIIDKKFKGDIEFRNLSYSFNDVDNVLNNVSLKIKDKEKVMIIGKSGTGKSTLAKILKKYYEVKRNTVFVNNIDINDYKKSDIVYVSQNEVLFNDTLLNNIDSNNIFDIAKICKVDEIINNNPLGYNMLIEENGFNLSGGERQRIILARAISNDFNILIIDEGLNQVDVNDEKEILNNLFNKYKDKTIIYISHRVDNYNLFNRLIKIEEGRVSDNRYIQ